MLRRLRAAETVGRLRGGNVQALSRQPYYRQGHVGAFVIKLHLQQGHVWQSLKRVLPLHGDRPPGRIKPPERSLGNFEVFCR
jgi:hypothetical protein